MIGMMMMVKKVGSAHDYVEALYKSILFFEGQRSGKLPPTQRMTWRKDSGLRDGFEVGVDLVGGYYDAGDNVKFNFPMAFSMTMLAWSVLEFGWSMGPDKAHARDAIRWGTDYFLKATSHPGIVYAQVGDPHADHYCWQRPEDMDTPRTPYAVSSQFPGSEVSAEIAAALAASSLVFKSVDPAYSQTLLDRAKSVFEFADKYRGSYNITLGPWVCPFYCDFSGYEDELLWAAAWLFKATKSPSYLQYVVQNAHALSHSPYAANSAEFGWDVKNAGINVLLSKFLMKRGSSSLFLPDADWFVCTILPESPTKSVEYSAGGLMFKPGGSNMQHATTLSYLLLVYAKYLDNSNRTVQCGNNMFVPPQRLIQVARSQFPQKIHHRGSTLPSLDQHPGKLGCVDGTPYFESYSPNPNVLTGAIVGGPDIQDQYNDSRFHFTHSEPTTYINAPFVGVLAYFKSHPNPS
ncbi:hypothetical protein CRG98_013833 [Punica granatum]|uniref:Endoglucanase n=1 Tax=Punica granatum TaxID=22663 RepID=A0A2I0KB58_PUNGR|nr:hypothetical protein CRG98_013833 [Punica granatum]